ncbi:hypothetical protein BD779DRAFT_1471142 [Infundibulicybe gibba]|nr:hypothetical protein BD779DRAFT_1471142 [Infundibulicybe gibba]
MSGDRARQRTGYNNNGKQVLNKKEIHKTRAERIPKAEKSLILELLREERPLADPQGTRVTDISPAPAYQKTTYEDLTSSSFRHVLRTRMRKESWPGAMWHDCPATTPDYPRVSLPGHKSAPGHCLPHPQQPLPLPNKNEQFPVLRLPLASNIAREQVPSPPVPPTYTMLPKKPPSETGSLQRPLVYNSGSDAGSTSSTRRTKLPSKNGVRSPPHDDVRRNITKTPAIPSGELRSRPNHAVRGIQFVNNTDFNPIQPTSATPTAESRPNRSRHPLPPFREICPHWLLGKCDLGYSCGRIHEDLDYDVEEPGQSPEIPNTPTVPEAEPKKHIAHDAWSLTVYRHIKVLIGSGFEIEKVTTGFESPWVQISNLPPQAAKRKITQLLTEHGEIVDSKFPNSRGFTATLKACYSSPGEAQKAITALNGLMFMGTKLQARAPINTSVGSKVSLEDATVQIQWEAPGKIAYAGYATHEQATQAMRAIRFAPPVGDFQLSAHFHTGIPAVGVITLRFRSLPLDAGPDALKFASPNDVLFSRPNYDSLPRPVCHIERTLKECGELLSFEVSPPPYRDGMVRAWAHFSSPADAAAACGRLHNRKPMCTGQTRIFAHHVKSLSYMLSAETYERLRPDITALQSSLWNAGRGGSSLSILDRRPTGPVIVKLSDDDLKSLGRSKATLEAIMRAEVMQEDGKTFWHNFFGREAGIQFLRDLQRANHGVDIRNEPTRRTIRLHGSSAQREIVRQSILAKAVELRSDERMIPLTSPLVTYTASFDIMRLQERHGTNNVTIDHQRCGLRIRGDDDAYRDAQEAVYRADNRRRANASATDCPVCFNQAVAPYTLRCGHNWCRACLKDYLIAAIETRGFPLVCFGNAAKCTERIPLVAARDVLPQETFEAVAEAALSAHVQSRPTEYRYCPSPDCQQMGSDGDTVPCMLLSICTGCHAEAHDGFDCPQADGGDKLFKEWVQKHDVKLCPGCKIPIERAAGCHHMTCTRCRTHICWVCLETFPEGRGIYDHMRNDHGGIGLQQDF